MILMAETDSFFQFSEGGFFFSFDGLGLVLENYVHLFRLIWDIFLENERTN